MHYLNNFGTLNINQAQQFIAQIGVAAGCHVILPTRWKGRQLDVVVVRFIRCLRKRLTHRRPDPVALFVVQTNGFVRSHELGLRLRRHLGVV